MIGHEIIVDEKHELAILRFDLGVKVIKTDFGENAPVETGLKVPPGVWKLLQPLRDGGWLCGRRYEPPFAQPPQ